MQQEPSPGFSTRARSGQTGGLVNPVVPGGQAASTCSCLRNARARGGIEPCAFPSGRAGKPPPGLERTRLLQSLPGGTSSLSPEPCPHMDTRTREPRGWGTAATWVRRWAARASAQARHSADRSLPLPCWQASPSLPPSLHQAQGANPIPSLTGWAPALFQHGASQPRRSRWVRLPGPSAGISAPLPATGAWLCRAGSVSGGPASSACADARC